MDREIKALARKIDEYLSILGLKSINLKKLVGVDGRFVRAKLKRIEKGQYVRLDKLEKELIPIRNKLREFGYRNAEIADDIDKLINLLKKQDEEHK